MESLKSVYTFLGRVFIFALPALIRASPRLAVLIFGAYAGLLAGTTGEPFTAIMFRHPYLFYVPAIAITAVAAFLGTKFGQIGRRWVVDLEIALAVVLGVVAGHVYW